MHFLNKIEIIKYSHIFIVDKTMHFTKKETKRKKNRNLLISNLIWLKISFFFFFLTMCRMLLNFDLPKWLFWMFYGEFLLYHYLLFFNYIRVNGCFYRPGVFLNLFYSCVLKFHYLPKISKLNVYNFYYFLQIFK